LDTGMGFANEESRLAQILEEENVQPAHIIRVWLKTVGV